MNPNIVIPGLTGDPEWQTRKGGIYPSGSPLAREQGR